MTKSLSSGMVAEDRGKCDRAGLDGLGGDTYDIRGPTDTYTIPFPSQ